ATPTTATPTTQSVQTTAATTPQTIRPAATGGPSPGVNFEEWNVPDGVRGRALDLLASSGMEWLRVDVGWRSFELECDNCYSDWYINRIDTLIADAKARGLDVMFTVGETPSWANSGDKLAPPADPAKYGEFMTWLANRYRGRVIGYEIWNEPDLEKFFHGDVGDYVELLQAAYRGVKAGDPNGTVVFGGPSHQNVPFISAAYDAGAGGYFDVMATHPYQGGSDKPPDHPTDGNIWWMTEQPTITELMRRHGDGHKEVWWTEFAWSVGPNNEGLPSYRRGVTEQQQGQYLVEALQLAADRYPNVTRAAWYNGLERVDAGADSWTRGYALIRRDMTPRPALEALRRYTQGG
ncbi:MAG: cellulase family glycosylhydrolase, partial [Acidimicrobiales bacterium]